MEKVRSEEMIFQYYNTGTFVARSYRDQSVSSTFYTFSLPSNLKSVSKLSSAPYWPHKSITTLVFQGNLRTAVDELQPPHKEKNEYDF